METHNIYEQQKTIPLSIMKSKPLKSEKDRKACLEKVQRANVVNEAVSVLPFINLNII